MNKKEYDSLTYRETLKFHDEMRAEIYRDLEREFTSLGIKVREITFSDVSEAVSWKAKWKQPGRAAIWNWKQLYNEYHSRSGSRRLDLAITKNNILLGLVYGMLERNRLILKVHAMEANPQNNPIAGKMLDMTLYAASVYALVNDTSEIWLCSPVSPAHTRLYQGRGYKPYYDRFDKCTHLIKRLV
ncbi:MAG: hypothetical protein ACI93R_003730 [Flavobacteriales bacterium]|jgi:hypothetical protein